MNVGSILKKCTSCSKSKPETDFSTLGKRSDSWCKECRNLKKRLRKVTSSERDAYLNFMDLHACVFDHLMRQTNKNISIIKGYFK